MWQEYRKPSARQSPIPPENLLGLRAEWADRYKELKENTRHWGGIYDTIRNLMEQDIRLPEEGAIELQDAQKKAEAAVVALPGWTREKLDMYGRLAEIHYQSGELNKPVFHFIFAQKRHYWPEFEGKPFEVFEKDYLKPLYALFGGEDTLPPIM